MSLIRAATPDDLPGAYKVCLQTGDSGRDATALYRDPELLGHVYVGPYVVGAPDLAKVVVDAGEIVGYLLAAEDTRRFERWAELHWWPPLRSRYPITDGDSPDDELIRMIHEPPLAPENVVIDYPAQLHIDLLASLRGAGLGRNLIDGLIVTLRQRGAPGVHLEVGSDNRIAIDFYAHLGFKELDSTDSSFLMGMRLTVSDPAERSATAWDGP
jgi:ribosomal protein S18 acetylase RimI-like enzyme